MINGYEIKKVYNEEILYLNISFDTEFAKLNSKAKKEKIDNIVLDFIKKNNIKFKGATVALLAGGMVMGYVILNDNVKFKVNNLNQYTTTIVQNNNNINVSNNDNYIINDNNETIKQEEMKEIQTNISKEEKIKTTKETKQTDQTTQTKLTTNNQKTTTSNTDTTNIEPKVEIKTEEEQIIEQTDNKNYITIKRSNGLITNIEIEEYVIGVVGAEMPASFNEEALKAQAVIARTYAVSVLNKGKILTDTSSTQNYKDNNELQKIWGSNYDKYYNKINNAVNDTKGLYLTYDGKIIDAVYHSTSNGQTENAEYVWGSSKPYLVSVDSPYDSTNKSFNYEKFITYDEISKKLNMTIDKNTEIEIINRTISNRVQTIKINNKTYTGVEIRSLLGLRSTDFEINKEENGINFKTKGYGHGVGMSQYGANGMAKAGYNYEQILTHYYTGVKLTRI